MQQLYRYYDPNESARILDLRLYDINECISEMEKYILTYPNDYTFQACYCAQLVTVNRLDEAKEYMRNLQDKVYKDESFLKMNNKLKLFKYNAFYSNLKIHMYKQEYNKAYALLQITKRHVEDMDLPELVCKVKKGYKVNNNDNSIDTYMFNQITNYKEELFLKKLHLHVDDGNEIGKKFYKKFPLERAYEEIKKNPGNRFNTGFIDNVSYYKYDNCGYVEGVNTDYFKAVNLHGTNNYIFIYPTIEGEFMDYTDLNHIPPKKKAKIYIAENKRDYL